MAWTRAELKSKAKVAFKANYWAAVLAAIIYGIVVAGATGGGATTTSNAPDNNMTTVMQNSGEDPVTFAGIFFAVMGAITIFAIIFAILWQLLLNPIQVGMVKFFVDTEGGHPSVGGAFGTCKGHWRHVAWVIFLQNFFIGLWTLLLIFPGIYKQYEYRMIPYLMAENPGMDRKEAFAKSKEMMQGNKWNAFVLDLSFLGWIVLSVCTLGILYIFYVGPYIQTTNAELYHTLKEA